MSQNQYHAHYFPITKNDLAAMREANRFFVRVLEGDDLRCSLVAGQKIARYGTMTDYDHVIPAGWSLNDYEKDDSPSEWRYTAFASLWHPTMETIARHVLRAGDMLHFHWIRGNYSEYRDKLGVTMDEVEMHILRGAPAAGKRKKLVFRISHELITGETPESCRMVRRKPA